jgi:hypothetical protein
MSGEEISMSNKSCKSLSQVAGCEAGSDPGRRWLPRFCAAVFLAFCAAMAMHAQSFPSGSTGADGNLIVNTPGVTVYNTPPMGGGTIYNFDTIQIAAGSTLRLSGSIFPTPLYFLAQGTVTIAGTLDLSGANGSQPGAPVQNAGFTVPGAGGYGGGASAFAGGPALAGLGPAGGAVYGSAVSTCPYGSTGGGFTGDVFLVPLVGGSGGGGGYDSGGAGGGAILIASSVSIIVAGTITANGGSTSFNGPYGAGGGGAGGGIRLVAPSIAGTGTITAAGGAGLPDNPGNCTWGASGIVRLEAFQQTFSGSFPNTTYYLATPINLFVPAATAQPSIMVTSIGGVAVPPNPTGSFAVPDVVLNSSAPVIATIQAQNIPVGTTASLYFTNESFPLQTVVSSPLAGTAASSTATATVTLHPGYSEGYIVATWMQ